MNIDTRIQGIPCQIEILSAGHYSPPCWSGHPDNWTPEESEAPEWRVLDRKGYPARWLEKKLTAQDEERIARKITDITGASGGK